MVADDRLWKVNPVAATELTILSTALAVFSLLTKTTIMSFVLAVVRLTVPEFAPVNEPVVDPSSESDDVWVGQFVIVRGT